MWPFNRRKRDQELDDEIRAHLAMAARDRVERGQAERDALLDARREFGSVELVKEVTRDIWGKPVFDGLGRDLRYSARSIFKSPGFALVAIASLSLGIGASTAVFSVVHHLLIAPLPYPDADRLVSLNEISPEGSLMSISYPDFKDWRAQLKSFETIGGIGRRAATLTGAGEPTQLIGRIASATMFELLGARAALGRVYTTAEDRFNGPHVIVLNHGSWQKRFGSDSKIVGKTVRLDGEPCTVIGVLAPGLSFYGGTDEFYFPLGVLESERYFMMRGNHNGLLSVAKLKRGVSVETAAAELEALADNLKRQYPETNAAVGAQLRPLNVVILGSLKTTILALFGAVGFVLLIACANVANLLLARVSERRREIVVRAALGASAWRIARELICESLLLGTLGGVLGTLLAYWGIAAVRPLLPGNYRLMRDTEISLPVLGFAILVSLAAALIFGLWPALHATDARAQQARGSSQGTGAVAFRRMLLAAEVALAVVLAVGATLLTRSLLNAINVQLGFRTENLLTAQVRFPPKRYNDAQLTDNVERIREGMAAIPGVRGATAVLCLPVDGGCWGSVFVVNNRAIPERANLPTSNWNIVADNYFEVMGIELKKGRSFQASDTPHSNPVAVINETAARRFFAGEDAVGRRVKQGWPEDDNPWCEIVGVVADVHQDGPTAAQNPEIFLPFAQQQSGQMWPVIRTSVPPATVENSLRAVIHNIDRDVPVENVRTMEWRIENAVESRRFNFLIVGGLSLLALVMAAGGVFSVIAYLVNQRTREIGIRVALGARSLQIIRSVLAEGFRMAAIGIAAGLLVAAVLMRLIQSMLFGVKPLDPLSFGTVAAGVAVVTLLACLAPSLRAARVDPVIALRTE